MSEWPTNNSNPETVAPHEEAEAVLIPDHKEAPLDPSEIVHEKHSVRPYSELGRGQDYVNNWGTILYKGEPRSLYLDEEIAKEVFTDEITASLGEPSGKFVRIADFGGADGALIRTVMGQLREQGYEVAGAIVDASLKEGKTKESWEQYRAKNPDVADKIIAIPANFIADQEQINLREESLDVILSRFVTQYFPESGRPGFFEAHARYLKDEGTLICEWPGPDNAEAEPALNDFWSGYAQIAQGIDPEEYRKVQHYPTREQVRLAAEDARLEVTKCEEVSDILFNVYEPMMANGSRFVELNEDQKAQLHQLYERLHEQHPNVFRYDEASGNLYYKLTISKLVAKKHKQ